jgi:hypothetical protein
LLREQRREYLAKQFQNKLPALKLNAWLQAQSLIDRVRPFIPTNNYKNYNKEMENNAMPKYFNATMVDDALKQGNSTIDKINKSIAENFNNGSNPGKKIIPTMVENKMSQAANLVNADGRKKIFITKYQTGYKPTRAVLDMAKQDGVGVKVLSDSKIQHRTSLLRNSLTHGQGFNEVELHVPCNAAQLTSSSVRKMLFGNSPYGADINRENDIRALVMNLKQQFIIKNQTTHMPLIFTIHVVKLAESPSIKDDIARTLAGSFYSGAEFTAGTELEGKVPFWYQNGGYFEENTDDENNRTFNVTLSRKLKNLRKASAVFKDTFEIIESFTHTIKPGDFWNFSHTHNCGAGIDAESLKIYNGPADAFGETLIYTKDYHPFSLGFIFQTSGKLVEAQVMEADNETAEYNPYIGTSPGQYMYEFKTSMNYVVNSAKSLSGTAVARLQNITDETLSTDLEEDNLLLTQEIRLPRGKWRETYPNIFELANIGSYVIPMTTQSFENLGAVTGPNGDLDN